MSLHVVRMVVLSVKSRRVMCLLCVCAVWSCGDPVTEVHRQTSREDGGSESNVFCVTKRAVFVRTGVLIDYIGPFEFVAVLC